MELWRTASNAIMTAWQSGDPKEPYGPAIVRIRVADGDLVACVVSGRTGAATAGQEAGAIHGLSGASPVTYSGCRGSPRLVVPRHSGLSSSGATARDLP